MAEYAVTLADPFGNPVGQLDWTSFECSRSVNTVGNATFTLTGRYPIGYFRKNQRLHIYRRTSKGGYLVGRTPWFVTQFSLDDDEEVWTLRAVDSIALLDRALIAYPAESEFADKTVENGNEDYGDNIIKAYVRENLGSLADDSSRDMSDYLEIDGDENLAPVIEKEAGYRKLLGTIQDIVKDCEGLGYEMYFDMAYTEDAPKKFRFVTRPDNLYGDRRDFFTFSKLNGTVEKAILDWDYSKEVTWAYVGGEGQGAERIVAEVNGGLNYGVPFERSEEFYDARDSTEDKLLETEGRTQLQRALGTLNITANLKESTTLHFGIDFDFGQRVRMAVRGYETDAIINAFSLKAQRRGGDELNIQVKGTIKDTLFVNQPELRYTIPIAPSNLTIYAVTATTMSMSWTDNSDDESYFIIERSLDGITGWTRVGYTSPNVTDFYDLGLTPSTGYFYRVMAVNPAGYSTYSATDNDTTLAA